LTHKKIGLPEDGKYYTDGTLEEFQERIQWLITLGYKVPDYVLKEIKEEMNTRENNELL
jgi:hypothetical protein